MPKSTLPYSTANIIICAPILHGASTQYDVGQKAAVISTSTDSVWVRTTSDNLCAFTIQIPGRSVGEVRVRVSSASNLCDLAVAALLSDRLCVFLL